MKFIYLYILWLSWLAVQSAMANGAPKVSYRSLRVAEIAEMLRQWYQVDCTAPRTYGFGSDSLLVTENENRQIDHIGWKIFPQSVVQPQFLPVYRFVERYLLELYLIQDTRELQRRFLEDKVTWQMGKGKSEVTVRQLVAQLPNLRRRITSSSISLEKGHYCLSVFHHQERLLTFRFPSSYELILGMGMKEIESKLYGELLRVMANQSEAQFVPKSADESSCLLSYNDSCFVCPGMIYIIEELNDTRFYKKRTDGHYEPLFDANYQEESVRNLFLMSEGIRVQAKVTQHLYGFKRLQFEVSLSRLMDFFKNQGCQAFVGIEKAGNQGMTGTVILQNELLGYCHLLYFETLHPFPVKQITLTLYAYVPTHNVNSLFG